MLKYFYQELEFGMYSIMVVDDSEDYLTTMVKSLKMKLEETDYAVTPFVDATKALSSLKESHWDLLITDIIMPNVEGTELISAAKSCNPNCKIIAISGGGSRLKPDKYLDDAMLQGADAKFEKPFSTFELSESIRNILG